MPPSPRKKETLKKILDCLGGYCGFWVLAAGLKMGILSAMACRGPHLSDVELARRARVRLPFVRTWLRAGCACGIVRHEAARGFSLAPYVKEILLDDKDPFFQGATVALFGRLSSTLALFSEGGYGRQRCARRPERPLLFAMAQATRRDYKPLLNHLAAAYGRWHLTLKKGGRILDVGTGLGYGVIELHQRYPACEITGIDVDARCVRLARAVLKKNKVQGKVFLRPMDARRMVFKEKFDLIFMNLSLHEIGATHKEKHAFLRRCRHLLAPGGLLVIGELFFPDDLRVYGRPFMKTLMGIQMCETVWGQEMTTARVTKQLLKAAGFKKIRQQAVSPDPTRITWTAGPKG